MQYPEWQKVIREAQAKAKAQSEELARKADEKVTKVTKSESEALGRFLVKLGLPEGTQDEKARVVNGYRFSIYEGRSDYHGGYYLIAERVPTPEHEELFSETETYPSYRDNLSEIRVRINTGSSTDWPREVIDIESWKGESDESMQITIADMIDQADEAYETAVKLATARAEHSKKVTVTPPAPSKEEQLVELIRRIIREEVSVATMM